MNFDKLTKYLDSLGREGIPGCHLSVWQNHKEIYSHLAGFRDEEGKEPMQGNETYWLYSTSKLYIAVAIMRLKEEGKLNLDDPVSKYLPAYEKMRVMENGALVPAKGPITLRHLLSMQGGLDYEVNDPVIQEYLSSTGGHGSTRQMVDVIARKTLLFHPGTHFKYSLCHDVLAGVVEEITGMPLGQYYKKHIFDPLEMKCMSFELTTEKKARLAAKFVYDDNNHTSSPIPRDKCRFVLSKEYESAGAGLVGDVDDYVKFSDALACDGVAFNGYRLLSRASIDEMRQNQLGPDSLEDYATSMKKKGYGYGLGVRTMLDQQAGSGILGPAKSPIGEFGWDSAAGAWVMVDVEKGLSAFYAMHILECEFGYQVVHGAVRDLIYEGLES